MKVLVTGAGGFVGKGLVPYLERQGHTVVRALRMAKEDNEVGIGDIGPDTDWRVALGGVEAVVHLAARVHVMQAEDLSSQQAFHRVNTAGTLNLARQAASAGVRRLVFLSSVKVLGEEGVLTAASIPRPADAYGQSKWAAEQGLHTVATNTGLEVVILRPPLIYGPGVGANFARLMHWVRCGVPLPLGGVRNRRSLLALGNLVDAVGWVLRHPAAAGRTYLLSDGEDVSTPDLIRHLAHALGRSARLLTVPPFLLLGLGKLLGRRAEIHRLLGSLVVDASAIRAELGWSPPFTLAAGLDDLVAREGEMERSHSCHPIS
ncbi:NAD-dependent epimerase/dehydratase family protein [Ferrovum myxofaciens]|uniref:NAD-dependent epimerase/dehydratase family protein n=2 Tax=root TaxID=1 RepID=A0A9E6SXG8_9PROT|nr:NAD-dependent epimerase/dehydratase family protein [Ferrovum myxofaciens]MBU6995829.1 NAD-dependent epimerase/dehydratase family protein [Ferrovum myxofaciens]QKE39388.1 MAG: NAD-dependent epimerase/dehydratase family protein [Ferrovum myxofaciens]QKE42005.1 MAG: NAD-dependent epimerase/dehydratase family protein [Ferrovum myxofaciens]QWY74662.1 MAG: NAD-dependent epimerase/dehydratase family protein [Ferrovum myxofaciens]QWY77408.1 MAG: NAD-dependent epimerase/dehydratase family protein [F